MVLMFELGVFPSRINGNFLDGGLRLLGCSGSHGDSFLSGIIRVVKGLTLGERLGEIFRHELIRNRA